MPDASPPRAPVIVEFQPSGRRVAAASGTTVLDVARDAGLGIVSVCGGAGLCDSCRVRVVRGHASSPSPHERDVLETDDLRGGWRLACQTELFADTVVEVPVESIGTEQRLQLESDARLSLVGVDDVVPPVSAIDVAVAPAHLGDLRSDADRVRDACARQGVVLGPLAQAVIAQLPDALRAFDWQVKVAFAARGPIGVFRPGATMLGLAVDVGTTKIAVYLVDLASGRTVACDGVINPQVTYGEDVISRIAYADRTPGGAGTLHRALVDTLNQLVERLCAGIGQTPIAVVDGVIVGNTVMHHLACGFSVAALGRAPYVPVVTGALSLPARDLGLMLAPGAHVYLPPNIAGYVGADHVAALLAVGAPDEGRTRLVIDIGTNTEISLFTAGRVLSCSCASGPAFEGAHVGCGMRAVAGAIERVRIVQGNVRCQTIGGKPPLGVCGSGVLDAVAELASHSALDRHGAFRQDHPLVSTRGAERVFVLAPAEVTGHNRELVLTRHDVTEIQLAKAAIRTGIDLLVARAGIAGDGIDEVVVAGAFGSYIQLASARQIGMLPNLPAARFRQVGNAAGAGARQMIVSNRHRDACEKLAARVEYLDLTTDPRFTEVFASAIGF